MTGITKQKYILVQESILAFETMSSKSQMAEQVYQMMYLSSQNF